jgi:histidinol dehydrogenase
MIDAKHQRRGLGRRAMGYVVQEAKRLGLTQIGLSHVDKPGHAGPFYEALGYRYTGEVDEGELKMMLDLTEKTA